MSAAYQAKSARARATIAIRMLKTKKQLSRDFDDCFEMFDGTEVVREIRRRSRTDEALVQALVRHRCDYWLKPDYLKDTEEQMRLKGL